MSAELLSFFMVQANAKRVTQVAFFAVLTFALVIATASTALNSMMQNSESPEDPIESSHHGVMHSTTIPQDPVKSLPASHSIAREKNNLTNHDDNVSDEEHSDEEDGLSLSTFTGPTNPYEFSSFSPRVYYDVPETSASVFEFYVNSELQGHVQTEGYEQGALHAILDNWRHQASVIGPPTHVVMMSFLTMEVHKCEHQTVEIFVGGRNLSEAELVETVCEGKDYDAKLYHANTIHLLWKMYKGRGFRFRPVPGFRLRFSFHKRSSLLLQQLPGGLWNCSVPQWNEFKSHFHCNYDTECAAADDEADCPYSGHCPPGHIHADGRCYRYVNPSGSISWFEANIMCAERYGGYLASLNTPEEWSGMASAFTLQKSHFRFFVGLRTAEPGKPTMYRKQLEWADGSMAVYLFQYTANFGDLMACGLLYPSLGIVFVASICDQRYQQHFLCEAKTRDSKLETANFTAPLSITSNRKIPFRHVRCPKGHMTHEFLTCDAKSSCYRETYTSSDLRGGASCSFEHNSFPPPFPCRNGFERVPYSLVCDHRGDCVDSSDEDFCVFAPCNVGEEMQCGGSKQCVQRERVCDGPVHCVDGSDEMNCGRRSTDVRFTPPPPAVVWTAWKQTFGGLTINKVTVTSYNQPCPEGFFQCAEGGYCLEVQFRCNGVRDCQGGQDEAGCAEYSCPGMYRCRGTRVCFRANKLCDGFGDCPEQDDELFCDLQCPTNCSCFGLAFTCPGVFTVTQFPHLRYLDASDSGLTPQHVNHSSLLIHLSLARCGLLRLGNLTLPNLRSLDLSGNNLSVVSVDEVNRMENLQELILAENPLTSSLLTGKQASLSLRYLDLSRVYLPSLIVNTQLPFLQFLNLSFAGLDELQGTGFQSLSSLRIIDLRGCPMTHLPRQILVGLQKLRAVYADSYKVCCQATLPLGFDIKNCHAPEDSVSSCDRLLKYDTHSVMVAVSAAVSVIGNVLSFIMRVFSKKTRDKPAQDVFLCHLCTSDFMMGIYLALIGVVDRVYRGQYLWEDVTWRQSVACKTAGILFDVFAQVSSLFIFIITVEHVVVLFYRRSGLGSKRLTVYVATSVVWCLGIISAVAPLFSSELRHSAETAICIPLIFKEQDNGQLIDLLVIPQCTLHAGVMAAEIFIFFKTRSDHLVALKADSVPPENSYACRFLPVAVCSCLCRLSLLVLALSLYYGSIASDEVRVAASVLVLPLSSALNPVLYAYGALRERRQAARNERLLKYLMAKRRAKVLNVE